MQTMTVSATGGPEVLQLGEVDLPQPGPGEVLVRVLAAGVGPWDVSLRAGRFGHDLPFVPGAEFAGVVVGDSGAAAAFDDGTPVYGYPGLTGCYAQYVTCPAEQLAPVPAALSALEAAAVPVSGLTAYQGIVRHLAVGPGETVLVTGAAGGVGHLAVQIARARGASVIATASPVDHDFVHGLGAATVLDYGAADWPEQVRSLTDGGVRKVLVCAAASLPGAAAAAADHAVIATPVRGEQPDAGRVSWRQYDAAPSGSDLIAMAPWFDEASLAVHVSRRFFWADAAAAHRELEKGHTRGKIVLVVDEDLAAREQI
jgi:NADPH:quinone reductase-like Zn-dependent oxidoreductase